MSGVPGRSPVLTSSSTVSRQLRHEGLGVAQDLVDRAGARSLVEAGFLDRRADDDAAVRARREVAERRRAPCRGSRRVSGTSAAQHEGLALDRTHRRSDARRQPGDASGPRAGGEHDVVGGDARAVAQRHAGARGRPRRASAASSATTSTPRARAAASSAGCSRRGSTWWSSAASSPPGMPAASAGSRRAPRVRSAVPTSARASPGTRGGRAGRRGPRRPTPSRSCRRRGTRSAARSRPRARRRRTGNARASRGSAAAAASRCTRVR